MQKMLLTLMSFVALSALVACGGGGSSNFVGIPPNPSGGNNAGYSNASLKGNYVFAVNGSTINNTYAVAGLFTADGAGNITSGVRDTVNDQGGQNLSEPITGNYSVNQDGRGQVVLNGGSGQVIYRFVLQSSSSLLSPVVGNLFQDGTTINNVLYDAIGRIEEQSAPSPTLAGPYIIRLDGEDSGQFTYGAVGGLNLSANSITSGTIDENDSGAFNPQLTVSSGSYNLAGNGRGTLGYVTPNSSTITANPQGSHNFIVYYVSPSRLELISTDQRFFLHGFAEMQAATVGTPATFTGDQVFNISGIDSNGNPTQETGRFTLNAAAGTLINGFEDFNDGGNLSTNTSFTGNYSVTNVGRWQASMNFNGSSSGLVGWQISPQLSVVLTSSSTLLETGTMRAQTLGLSNASVTGNYAVNFSGFDFFGGGNNFNGGGVSNINGSGNASLEGFESTGNFSADGAGNLFGTIDSQSDSAGISVDTASSGAYSIDPVYGRGTGFIGNVPVSIYTVDANTMYLFSTDSSSLYLGMMVKQ